MSLRYVLDDYDMEGFLRQAKAFDAKSFAFVVTPNADHLIRYHDEPVFRASYADADYILLDSRFLSIFMRIAKAIRLQVCTGSDLTAQLFARVISPTDRVVLLGCADAQARMLAERHGLKDLHHFNPPMGFIKDPTEVERCVEFIESRSPFRFCFLAVGVPQQEMIAHRLKSRGVARGMALCIGASINFLTGVERRAPCWMQRIGMEWLFRLARNPLRLANRYLVRGPRIFALMLFTDIVVRPQLDALRASPAPGAIRPSA